MIAKRRENPQPRVAPGRGFVSVNLVILNVAAVKRHVAIQQYRTRVLTCNAID
jgi:hypothetical protein